MDVPDVEQRSLRHDWSISECCKEAVKNCHSGENERCVLIVMSLAVNVPTYLSKVPKVLVYFLGIVRCPLS
jgi:hypothetical protein